MAPGRRHSGQTDLWEAGHCEIRIDRTSRLLPTLLLKVVTWSGVEKEATSVALMVKKFSNVQKLNSCPGGTTSEQGADSEAESE